MSKVLEIPQHVLDARFLQGLAERLLPPEDEEESITEKVGEDLVEAAGWRSCDCDPDKRRKEGFDEDSDKEDGWFCMVRDIEDDYCTNRMHVVLDRVRSAIEQNRGDFSEDIYQEICERCSIEQAKLLEVQEQEQNVPADEEQNSPPHSPLRPCIFPPFSLQHLPPEVLTEIALAAQAFDPHVHITLSHVDASLRTFVKSTPLLWARVDLLYPLHLVHLYLERSADVPLRVTMLSPLHNVSSANPLLEDVALDEKKRMQQFMRALYPHRHRILSFRLRCDDLQFHVSAENEGQVPAPEFLWDGSMVKLELLDLELHNWRWKGGTVPSSGSIRDLHLHGPWTKFSLPLFSSRLRSLTITDDDTPSTKVFNALQAAPCLISLALHDMTFTGPSKTEGSVLTFDQLESLSFIRTHRRVATALLDCITAPNLVSLVIHYAVAIPIHKGLPPRFLAPQPSVQRLDLTNCEGGPSFFASVFRTFPGVTHLRIASSSLSDQCLLPLVVGEPDATETTCPKLKHLTIDNEFNPITGVIRLIVFSRHSAGITLESVTLRGIPMDAVAYNDLLRLGEIIPKLDIVEFDQELDVHGDSDACSMSETSSEGDWASGDEEVVTAYRKYGDLIMVFYE